MRYTVNVKQVKPGQPAALGADFSDVSPTKERISFNSFYMEKDGKPFYPVSG